MHSHLLHCLRRTNLILPCLIVLASLAGCRSAPPPAPPLTQSTRELLANIAQNISSKVPFAGEPCVVAQLSKYRHDSSIERFDQRLRLAQALVRVGRPADAVELYDELLDQTASAKLSPSEVIDRVEFPRAVAYLRLGESENCIARHGADSCLFPIRATARHCVPRGSRGAIAAFEKILERRPDDLVVRWLLNIAYMTVGRKAEDIRPEWRLRQDTAVGSAPDDFPPFLEVGGMAGVAVRGVAGGCIVDDFDNDGYLDIMASALYPIDAPEGQLRLFHNRRDGTFADVTQTAGLEGIRGGLNILQADYDNNGCVDVLILRGAWQMEQGQWPNTLLRNEGDGTFTDVTAQAGVLALEPTQAAAWGDFDNDGWIDLYVGNETGFPIGATNVVSGLWYDLLLSLYSLKNPQVQGHLYRNQGNGTFRDVFQEAGFHTLGWVKGAAWGDYDRDGRIDLYVSRYGAPNLLYHNDGPGDSGEFEFTDVSASAGVSEPIFSFPTWFWDYDNDGWDDIFVAGYPKCEVSFPKDLPMELTVPNHDEIADFLGLENSSDASKPRLFHNQGDGTFADVTKEAGLWKAMSVMGSNFGDFDNDGFLDMYLGTGSPPFYSLVPNRAFHNTGGGKFDDVTVAAHLGSLAKGHGVAFGDIDNDGDQDIYTVLGGAFPGDDFPNALFRNPGHGNDWITLKLEGTTSNRAAIGARVELTLSGRSGGRKIFRTVGSGGSFGASSLQLGVGLGRLADDDSRIEDVEITWPDRNRTVQKLGQLQPNAVYFVRQGAPASYLELARLPLGQERETASLEK